MPRKQMQLLLLSAEEQLLMSFCQDFRGWAAVQLRRLPAITLRGNCCKLHKSEVMYSYIAFEK